MSISNPQSDPIVDALWHKRQHLKSRFTTALLNDSLSARITEVIFLCRVRSDRLLSQSDDIGTNRLVVQGLASSNKRRSKATKWRLWMSVMACQIPKDNDSNRPQINQSPHWFHSKWNSTTNPWQPNFGRFEPRNQPPLWIVLPTRRPQLRTQPYRRGVQSV